MPNYHRRGGHFPGHLRDAFVDAVDAMHAAWPDPLTEKGRSEIANIRITIDDWPTGTERHYTLSQIFGMLWNCTDFMPGDLCRQIEGFIEDFDENIRCGTYASGSRALKRQVDGILRISGTA
jgi:hypothetical protein